MLTRTENAIIDAFNKLIEKIDFNKISVDMILTAANVSRSTFYRYFKDKYEVMNANYKHLLDYFVAPERSSGYRDLIFQLFDFAKEHARLFKNAMESTGFNSFSNFVYEYSYQTALEITRANRSGAGFSRTEELQVDIFCNGLCGVLYNIVNERYKISASEAADALYDMMPESLKHYWWPVTDLESPEVP